MTLGRLVLAWIVVAAWFEIATFATVSFLVRLASSQDAVGYIGHIAQYVKRRPWKRRSSR